MSQTTTVDITINGDTRTIEIYAINLDTTHAAHSALDTAVATIGRGTARYPTHLMLWPLRAGQTAHAGNTEVTDAQGRRWQYHLQTCVRNRQARIVGWNDGSTAATNDNDQTRTGR